MRRFFIIILIFTTFPALAEMGGVEFLRLCKRDAVPCAGTIREHLKLWPKQVLDPAALKADRIEQLACPPHRKDRPLADLFVAEAERLKIGLEGKTVHEAVETVFSEAFPACASSRDS